MAFDPWLAFLLALPTPASPPASTPARPIGDSSLASLVSSDDYPIEALRKNEQGRVAVALTVDPSGRVSGCEVRETSGSASLDQRTCVVLRGRARFDPARDAAGVPVSDLVTQKVDWRIAPRDQGVDAASIAYLVCTGGAVRTLAPGADSDEIVADRAMAACPLQEDRLLAAAAKAPPGSGPSSVESMRRAMRPALLEMLRTLRAPPIRARADSGAGGLAGLISVDDYPPEALRNEEQGMVGVRLAVDPSGRASGCTVFESSGSTSLDDATCALLQQRARFIPARDASGQAVADSYVQRVAWRIREEDPAVEGAVGTAVEQWATCLSSQTRRLAVGPGGLETIVDRAFSACSSEENAAAQAFGEPSAAPAGKAIPKALRDALRRTMVGVAQSVRGPGPR